MIRLLVLILTISALLINFSSCLNDKADLNALCDTTYYAREIRPIFLTKCAVEGCHVQGGLGVGDFTKFDQIAPRIKEMQFRISLPFSDVSHMPQNDSLTNEQFTKLNDWIKSGGSGC